MATKLKAPSFKFKPVKIKAPIGSTGDQLAGMVNVILGVSLFAATVPLIGAASN